MGDVFRRALAGALDKDEWTDETPGGLRRLLTHIANQLLVDLERHHGAQMRSGNEVSLDGGQGAEAGRDLPASMVTQTQEAVHRELLELGRRTLSEREWAVFELVHVGGMEPAEVAAELNETDAAVRGVLFRARQKLVAMLAREQGPGSAP